MQARLFHLHALSALHCGTGQSAGVVDLPIARARATQLPIVPGSSLRGVLRQQAGVSIADRDQKAVETLFGPRSVSSDRGAFAGALAIGDAHLLALPVRCLAGIVSFVTCPFILRRYARDLKRTGASPLPELPSGSEERTAETTSRSVNLVEQKLVLEDLDLPARHHGAPEVWAERIARDVHPDDPHARDDFVARFAIVPDDVMGFLAETATEVRARIRLDPDTGTASQGALWYEEHLPAETVLWGVLALSASNNDEDRRSADDLAEALPGSMLLQLGGSTGVGHGLIRFLASEVAA